MVGVFDDPRLFCSAYSRRGLGCFVCLRLFVVTNYSYMNARHFSSHMVQSPDSGPTRRTTDRLIGRSSMECSVLPPFTYPAGQPRVARSEQKSARKRVRNDLDAPPRHRPHPASKRRAGEKSGASDPRTHPRPRTSQKRPEVAAIFTCEVYVFLRLRTFERFLPSSWLARKKRSNLPII